MEMDAGIKRDRCIWAGPLPEKGPQGEEFHNPPQSRSERKRSLIRETARHMSDSCAIAA